MPITPLLFSSRRAAPRSAPVADSGAQVARDSVPAVESSQIWLPSRSRPSLENCGFARAMMKQMPSKMALSASGIGMLAAALAVHVLWLNGRSLDHVAVSTHGDGFCLVARRCSIEVRVS